MTSMSVTTTKPSGSLRKHREALELLPAVSLVAAQQSCGHVKEGCCVDYQSLPVLDSAAIGALQDEAGEVVARRFVEEYLLMLPARAAQYSKAYPGRTRSWPAKLS